MKKKQTLWIVIIVVIILVVAAAIFGKQYYDNRYIGKDFYTMIPLDYDITSKPIYDMSGKEQIGTGVEYKLTAYNDKGESKTVEFTAMDDSEDIPQHGTYLKVNASAQLVLKWDIVKESDVPSGALDKIKNS